MGSFSIWIQGIIHAALSGAANSLGGVMISPSSFDIHSKAGWVNIGLLAAWGGFIGTVGFLRQSPLGQKA